jgi:hypothetical protein
VVVGPPPVFSSVILFVDVYAVSREVNTVADSAVHYSVLILVYYAVNMLIFQPVYG